MRTQSNTPPKSPESSKPPVISSHSDRQTFYDCSHNVFFLIHKPITYPTTVPADTGYFYQPKHSLEVVKNPKEKSSFNLACYQFLRLTLIFVNNQKCDNDEASFWRRLEAGNLVGMITAGRCNRMLGKLSTEVLGAPIASLTVAVLISTKPLELCQRP